MRKIELNDLLDKKAQGVLVRSCFRNISEMDAPSKFFFGLELQNGQRRQIIVLASQAGVLLTESSDFKALARDFYSKLFESEFEEKQEIGNAFFNGRPKFRKDSAVELEKALTLEELNAAVMGIENE